MSKCGSVLVGESFVACRYEGYVVEVWRFRKGRVVSSVYYRFSRASGGRIVRVMNGLVRSGFAVYLGDGGGYSVRRPW